MILGYTKIHLIDWLRGLIPDPCKSENLVSCSTTRTKSALFLFNPRFNYKSNPSFQHLRVNFPRVAECCDFTIIALTSLSLEVCTQGLFIYHSELHLYNILFLKKRQKKFWFVIKKPFHFGRPCWEISRPRDGWALHCVHSASPTVSRSSSQGGDRALLPSCFYSHCSYQPLPSVMENFLFVCLFIKPLFLSSFSSFFFDHANVCWPVLCEHAKRASFF